MKHLRKHETILQSAVLALAVFVGVFPSTTYAAVPLLIPAAAALVTWLLKWGALAGLVYAFADYIVAYLGFLLLNLATYILTIAGNIFNWLVQRVIVSFAQTLNDLGMTDGINTVWTAFRDISNIAIIGMFTFIAICIILGAKEYGQKKLIAHVLIVAVLLNFSLLFAKIIIDASNFTALQFYTAAGLPSPSGVVGSAVGAAGTATPAASSATVNSNGISGQFLNIIKITSFADTKDLLLKSAKVNGVWLAFGVALVGTVLLLVIAVVFLYGSFMITARAVLLVFIMIISPLSFASWLIPGLSTSTYGFKGWWSNLMKCAVFAPILMVFLWASLLILSKASETGVTFGQFLIDPTNPNAWRLVVVYLFTIGLLFISIRFASSFASKIAGFNMASMIPGIGVGLAGLATGMLGRTAVGWPAARGLEALRRRAYGYRNEQGEWVAGKGDNAATRFAARRLAGFQKATFNPLKTTAGALAAAAVGVPKVLTGAKAGEGGFEGVMARKAKAADDLARKIGPTDSQRAEALRRDQAQEVERRRERRAAQTETIAEQRRLIATIENQERPAAESRARQNQPEREGAERELTQARERLVALQREQAAATEDHASQLRIAEARAANGLGTEAEVANLRATRQEAMAGETQRIAEAQEVATRHQQTVNQLDEIAGRAVDTELATNPQIREFNRVIQESTRNLEAFDEEERRQGDADRVARGQERQRDIALRESLLWDQRAAPKITDEMRAHTRRQNWADFNAAVPPAERGGGGGAAPPAAPAAPEGGH